MKKNILSISVLILLGGLLAWLLLIKSFAAYYAEASPETALALNAHEQTALIDLAYKKYAAAENSREKNNPTNIIPQEKENSSSPSQNDRIEKWAKMALPLAQPNEEKIENATTNEQGKTEEGTKETKILSPLNQKILLTKEVEEARKTALKVALINPLDPDALQLLGIIADQAG
ncbi:MAG: hypothetical protein ACKOW3_00335, partial [Hyphomicrobium sp.]